MITNLSTIGLDDESTYKVEAVFQWPACLNNVQFSISTAKIGINLQY